MSKPKSKKNGHKGTYVICAIPIAGLLIIIYLLVAPMLKSGDNRDKGLVFLEESDPTTTRILWGEGNLKGGDRWSGSEIEIENIKHKKIIYDVVVEDLNQSESTLPIVTFVKYSPGYRLSMNSGKSEFGMYLANPDGRIAFADEPEIWRSGGHAIYMAMAAAAANQQSEDKRLIRDLELSIGFLPNFSAELNGVGINKYKKIAILIVELEQKTNKKYEDFWKYTHIDRQEVISELEDNNS